MAELIVLNGIKTALDDASGREFVCDCVRAGEGLITDAELREKYAIAAADWRRITKNKSLIQAIRSEAERRVRTGQAAQEAASKHFAGAPKVLNELMTDKATHPKFRIESARELRTVAIGDGNKAGPPGTEKFVINIDLGAKHEYYEKTITPKELTADELEWGWRDRE
jgi:hypothetical protein